MPKALKHDGVNDKAVCTTPWYPTTNTFSYGITFIAGALTQNILGDSHNNGAYIRADSPTTTWFFYNGNNMGKLIHDAYVEGEEYTLLVDVVAGAATIKFNDSTIGTGTGVVPATLHSDITTSYTGFKPLLFSDYTVKRLWFTDPSDVNNSPDWDFNLSSGDQVVASNGWIMSLIDFPGDNSQWVDVGGEPASNDGALDVTLDDATTVGSGSVEIQATADITLDDATAAGIGDVEDGEVYGTLNITTGDATAVGLGSVEIQATADITTGDAVSTGFGFSELQAHLSVTLDDAVSPEMVTQQEDTRNTIQPSQVGDNDEDVLILSALAFLRTVQ